jgi:F-type H+-transporting ATPase subunit delta
MKNEVISKRYADAFLEFARDTIGFEKGLEELRDLKRVFHDNPEIGSFIESPQITDIEKRAFIDDALKDNFSEEARQFLKLLLNKGRINILLDIADYARVAYSHGVEVEALLKTSYPLDTEDIQKIKDSMEKKFKKKLHLYVELDSDLLGGICMKVENTIIDGSVRRRLDDLKEKLIVAKVS